MGSSDVMIVLLLSGMYNESVMVAYRISRNGHRFR